MRDASGSEGNSPKIEPQVKEKRLLRVDQVYVRKDRQWRYMKTAKIHSDDFKLRKYSIVVRRVISRKGTVTDTRVDVKGHKLAELLKDVLRDLGQLELSKTPPELSPRQLYHAWPGLKKRLEEEQSKAPQDVEFMKDLTTAISYLETDFGNVDANMLSLLNRGQITYELLWALFTPREILFSDENILREPQAYMFSHGDYVKIPTQGNVFEVTGKMLHHDGRRFGWGFPTCRIKEFVGEKAITSLPCFPLSHHHSQIAIREGLIARGRDYVKYATNPVCLEYQGLAVTQHTNINGLREEQQIAVTARIMADPGTSNNQNPNDYLLAQPYVQSDQEVESVESLNDHEVMLSNHRIQGFAFNQKVWAAFAISRVKPVIWNEKAFDKLILDKQRKKMIKLLVQGHQIHEAAFDDFVLGKGKGLVGLLSGPPGVGKTLTAEVVAEMSRRPLYVISAGELGITVNRVDEQLGSVLEITRRWGCVLLIDEADVFLHKRGEVQLERNALVSVFLRRLEYFQGIVMLTTNRRKDIDQAFKSRIHFSFHYSALSETDRFKIWQEMLGNVTEFVQSVEFSDTDLRTLAERPMNGREIKNAVASAASIVRAGKEPLTATLVTTAIRSLVDDQESDEDI
ncbi:AAA family ATPase [Colletotrichum gloeosporioides Cg-14]|uniref:AAA family ATPase n=1 Tax=Colletotrichum gloeosporioides (strain Cg-14) TaxID=1237896 RepID=T0M4T2_COLGC|nr:AAA family ATPase [Colletotrichum gloeosporioides Cg-14]